MTDNELIAEFLGWRKDDWNQWISSFNGAHFDVGELRYNQQWDWLMPVVEKISKMQYEDGEQSFPRTFGMTSDNGRMLFRFNRQPLWEKDTLIEVTYLAVVEFIKWHNSQK